MYWLLNLPWGQPGMYDIVRGDLQESFAENISKPHILTTDPDLNYLARTIYDEAELALFPTEFNIDDVLLGKISIETIKNIRHYFLLAERFEIVGKLIKADKYFKIVNIMGVETILTKTFRLGSPVDDY
jgi:hypothetical protein